MASVSPSGNNPSYSSASVTPFGFSKATGEFYTVKYKEKYHTVDRFNPRYTGFDPSNPVNFITSEVYKESYNSNHQVHHNKIWEQKTTSKMGTRVGKGLQKTGKGLEYVAFASGVLAPETLPIAGGVAAFGETLKAGGKGLKHASVIYDKVNDRHKSSYDLSQITKNDMKKMNKQYSKFTKAFKKI